MLSHSQRMPLRDSRLGSEPQHHRPHGSLPRPHCSQIRETERERVVSHHSAGTEGDILATVYEDFLIISSYFKPLSFIQNTTCFKII